MLAVAKRTWKRIPVNNAGAEVFRSENADTKADRSECPEGWLRVRIAGRASRSAAAAVFAAGGARREGRARRATSGLAFQPL